MATKTMKIEKYVNNNSYTVFLPSKSADGKGGSGMPQAFRPGQYQTDRWYSRFCGRNQLTRVVEDVPIAGEGGPDIPKAVPDTKTEEPSLTDFGVVTETETKQYTRKNGVYTCKLCGLFRTGGIKSLALHTQMAHKSPLIVDRTATKLDKTPPATEESSKGDADPEPALPPETADQTESGESEEEEKPVFSCEVCLKSFATSRGLKMHITKMHKPKVDK